MASVTDITGTGANTKAAPMKPRPTRLITPKARVGLIIPSSNRLAEPQFYYYAPPGLGVHAQRLRMTGPHHRPLPEIYDDIRGAAGALADSQCDCIVFHCTGGAMEDGPEAEAKIIDIIRAESGALAMATGEAIVDALKALALRKLVLISPYRQSVNDAERAYLGELGFEVVHDIGLNLKGGSDYIHIEPQRWLDLTLEAMAQHPEADGALLSCTNTTQIEAVAEIESRTGKACVSSNQAVLWAVTRALAPKLGGWPRLGGLGRLFGNA